MFTQGTTCPQSTAAWDRHVVTVESLAGALENRMYGADVDEDQVLRECDYAVQVGLAAVLCRPEHVATAARRVAGTTTAAVTALAFHDATRLQRPEDLAAEAIEMVGAGASEVSLIVAPGLDGQGCLELIREQVDAVVEAVTPLRAKVRVLLNTTEASEVQVKVCTTLVGERGPELVQGGSHRGDRATFSQIEAMRRALPPHVLLKWTQPVKSLEMMLVCMALGVNRFNGDIPTLLKCAQRSTQLAPLMLPLHGVDF